jgi:hypothetical protein
MEKDRAPHDESSVHRDRPQDSSALVTSLTDLIDEMDRASFRRALASREHARRLEISAHSVRARAKT